jgi:predicted ATP-dependent endonuclease of OLD family
LKVKSFRIRNYRSIKDSGVCYLSGDNITILAGKNESGKTAILEALEDFNKGRQIREEAVPINRAESQPEISVTFEIDKETLSEISDKIGIRTKPTQSVEIEYKKKYPNEYRYVLLKRNRTIVGLSDQRTLQSKRAGITRLGQRVDKIYSDYLKVGIGLPEINLDNTSNLVAQLNTFRNSIEPHLAQIADDRKRDSFIRALEGLIEKTEELTLLESAEQNSINEIMQRIPNFILFSSFEDIFPSEIPLAEATKNELIKDLQTVSDLDLELIRSGTASHKATHKKRVNVKLGDDYRIFWEQDLTNLHIDWDSNNLQFFITEGDIFYPPKMRSKGKQWHLAFYMRVSARALEDVPNIILIDEPGLFLHAQAQKDVMKKLEDCAKYTQIIFSTHSPYLIDINKLNRIRLVLKPTDQAETIISNKIHKDADKETLTPIITAIGLDLSTGLDIAKNNNVIFEGISDYYYVLAFHRLLSFEFSSELHFIPGSGADKINLLASLMIGWGFNYCVVLDNDRKGRQTRDRLIKNFGHTNIKIIMVSDKKDEEVEDLFTTKDFTRYVLNVDYDDSLSGKKNSQLIKKNKSYDKVLLAKSFFEKANSGEITLSAKTMGNFKRLLEKINSSVFANDSSH